MLILGIDTSGRQGSVALARGTENDFSLMEIVPLTGGTFSAQLIPEIAAVLARHSLGAADLEGFAVASGPGSFTGLRVGLVAIKGLAEVLNKPIAAVSVLEALIWSRRISTPLTADGILCALDAGHEETYLGEYEFPRESGRPQEHDRSAHQTHILDKTLFHETLVTHDELVTQLRSRAGYDVLTPDPSIAAILKSENIQFELVGRPDSSVIARLGLIKLLQGETTLVDELDANYIRRPEAETLHAKARGAPIKS